MHLKKLFALLLAGTMAMSMLAGCGGENGNNEKVPTDTDIVWSDPTEAGSADTYTIKVDAGENAGVTVTYENDQNVVNAGGMVTFTVTAEAGYQIKDITINGKSLQSSDFAFPSDSVQVTLSNVNSSPVIVVESEPISYQMSWDTTGAAAAMVDVDGNVSVAYGEEAAITVDTKDDAQYEISVSATVDGTEANVVKENNTYTVSQVTGDVHFIVDVKEAAIESVTLSGAPATTEYAIGESFDVTGLEALVKYTNGNEVSIPLTNGNTKVTPGQLAKGDTAVKIEYTRPDGKTETLTWSGISVVYLTSDEVNDVQNTFNGYVEANQVINPNFEILKVKLGQEFIDDLKNKATEPSDILEGGIYEGIQALGYNLKYQYKHIGGADANDMKKAIELFYQNQYVQAKEQNLNEIKILWQTVKVGGPWIYNAINKENGTCDMWVVYLVKK